MKQSRVPLLLIYFSINRIADFIIIIIKHRQAIFSFESIYQILRRLMKIPSTRPHSPASVQHIRPVGTSETGIIIFIIRTLYGKYRFFAVLVVGQEDIAKVFQIIIIRVCNFICIGNYLPHIFLIDMTYTRSGLIAVSPCQTQITFGQISGSGNLIDTPSIRLFFGQHVVSCFKIGNYFTKQPFIRKLVIRDLLDTVV